MIGALIVSKWIGPNGIFPRDHPLQADVIVWHQLMTAEKFKRGISRQPRPGRKN